MNHNLIPPRAFGRLGDCNRTDLGVTRRLKRRGSMAMPPLFFHRNRRCGLARLGIALLILVPPLVPLSLLAQPQIRVGQFRPSANGLHFVNDFTNRPYFTIQVGLVNVPIGDAANGMCGGMGFAVRDYYESGLPLPTDASAPSSGPLFDYLAKRLFDSFDLLSVPPGPDRYMFLMNPALPDHETDASRAGLAPHGRAWVSIREEWPVIRTYLDAGVLSPLALIRVKSLDPGKLGLNHQVLAYGYTLTGDDLRIYVYDPNHPDDDEVYVGLNISNPDVTTTNIFFVNGQPSVVEREAMWCFFRTAYSYDTPPPGATYVDANNGCLSPNGAPGCVLGTGGPFLTVNEGAQAAPSGGNVLIRTGSYQALTITKPLTLRAWGGPVSLGR